MFIKMFRSFAKEKMQINTTVKQHYCVVNVTKLNSGNGTEKMDPLYTANRLVNWHIDSGKLAVLFFFKLNMQLLSDLAVVILGI